VTGETSPLRGFGGEASLLVSKATAIGPWAVEPAEQDQTEGEADSLVGLTRSVLLASGGRGSAMVNTDANR